MVTAIVLLVMYLVPLFVLTRLFAVCPGCAMLAVIAISLLLGGVHYL